MTPRKIPSGAEIARETPLFTAESVPKALLGEHHTSVWAELVVECGTVLFIEAESTWQATAKPESPVVIVPDRRHRIEPSTDARFRVRFFALPES